MQTVTGVFSGLGAARDAVRELHEAGISEAGISIEVSGAADAPPVRSERQSERIGRQAGTFAADVGRTAAAFVPFLGNDLAGGALSRAFRDASESAGATTGRLVDAIAEGAFVTMRKGQDGADDRVSVSVRAQAPHEDVIRDILVRAGAIRIAVDA